MSLLGRCKCVLLLCTLSACAAGAEEKHHKDPPSAAEKKQAVSALLRAREISLAMRKNGEAKELLKQIPRLLATAGSAASARETVTMLAASDREGALSEVVRAQLLNDDVAGALET